MSVHINFILREFRFMSKMFGRGLFYVFVGVYYLNVVSGGVESTSAHTASGHARSQYLLGRLFSRRDGHVLLSSRPAWRCFRVYVRSQLRLQS